jgi:hypothetical protein
VFCSRHNNPAVGLATRTWLGVQAETGKILDPACRRLVQRVLDKVRGIHPGGLAHGLALELGAASERALLVGSICELFYAACSVTDDLQDGDTDAYLGDLPMSLRINAQAQLLGLVAVRLHELARLLPAEEGRDLMAEPYRVFAIMLTGQQLELTRDPWDVTTYEIVARLSAGEQFGLYASIAARAAGAPAEPWVAFGRCLGTALQIAADIESADERFVGLPRDPVADFVQRVEGELVDSAKATGLAFAIDHAEGIVQRCRSLRALS